MKAMLTALVLVIGMGGVALADPTSCNGCAIEEQQPTQTAGCENGGCALEEPVATDDC